MKKIYLLPSLSILIFILLILTGQAESNWILPESKNSIESDRSKITDTKKKDSLPKGVTEEWLNNLRDENGIPIIPESNGEANSRQVPEDPETDALQRKIFNGFGSGNYFGYSISSAGDVNGDGYSDVIVGAFGYSTSKGRAYIYFGGLNMNTVPDVVMTGEATNNSFGYSVSSAGDVNGDGYSDVIVGAYRYSSSTGRSYIYFGGALMNNTADVTMTGEFVISQFGISVSSAGDVNGDGYSDVIVGADEISSGTGKAYIYFGGVSMNNTSDVTLTGETTSNNFGRSVASAGDVNSDGYSDVIVGAYGNSAITGRAYIFFGGASMNNFADVTLTGEAIDNYFGISVASAGDVNGDGYSDVIVGASGYISNKGRAYVYFGGASMNNVADAIFTGELTFSYFGFSVSSAGDVNGDGYSDLIIGSSNIFSNDGKIFIYFGGINIDTTADFTVTGEPADNFGISVASAGDVNGDGYSDIIAGANTFSSNTGRVYLYDYFMKNEIIQDLTITGEATEIYFGRSVSSAGDVNGDGYSDVIVGAWGYSSNTGRAYIFLGGISMDNIADITLTGEANANYFGISVSSAGDVNGDGYSDVIVGASGYSSSTGRAYVFYGGVSMNNSADVIMTGEAINNNFGVSVSTSGDVNGDGYSDVVIGAELITTNTGKAYIFLGGAAMNNTSDVTFTGETVNNYFGCSVSSAGDVNGDGFSDVIIGASGNTTNTGKAYIYFGGTIMNNASDVTFTGEAISNYFGNSVSSAGDVNGDGFSDVIISASENTANTGKAYIYFGGTIMNNAADVTMTGETTNNFFGISVASAGDVNGDGFSDVIIGAYGNTANTGKAYIYFGGAIMNNAADVTMTSEAEETRFGRSVSSAGDVNGDGYSDFMVGGDGYYSSTGRSYIYLGSAISAKPILNYVKDVPNDQGGFVDLKWARSSYDVIGMNMITDYVVQRSAPPVGGNFAWVNLAYIPATKEPFYSYISNTPNDSSNSSNGSFFFRITARTSVVNQFWRSAILSGRSIDNIAPPMVSPFTAAKAGSNVNLNWGASPAPDLQDYILFRSTSPTIDPYTDTPLSSVNTTAYIDTSPLSGLYYYFIVAQDIHNNYSPVAVTESPNVVVNLTLFIEGFYNAGSNSQISDTVKVLLRNSSSPFAVADETTGVVASDGTVQLKFGNAPSGNYFITVTHRNSIETWSASGIAVTISGSVNYNFSTASSQAFGNNMIQIDSSPIRYGIYSGDVNQDGTIDLADGSLIDNDAANFVSGYVSTDVNGDGIVDVADAVFADNNGFNFVSKITP